MLTAAQKTFVDANPYKVRFFEGVGGGTFQFQPGDGTRYVVTVRGLSDAECDMHGCMTGSRMLTFMVGANRFVSLCSPGVPHGSYLQEKLGMTAYTARAWEALLNFVVKGADFTTHDWSG